MARDAYGKNIEKTSGLRFNTVMYVIKYFAYLYTLSLCSAHKKSRKIVEKSTFTKNDPVRDRFYMQKPVVWAVWKSFQSSFTPYMMYYVMDANYDTCLTFCDPQLSFSMSSKRQTFGILCVYVKKREANTCSATVWQLFSTYSSYHFHHYHHQHNQSVWELWEQSVGI